MNAENAQKILSPVPYEQGFHFFMTDGHYSGETATSLCIFLRDMERVDIQSIRFHFERGDFEKWIEVTLGDDELARKVSKIVKNLSDEKLRKALVDVVQERISQLQLIST